jgi:cystathionine beta-lyase/cystathionine gamma-synthase
MGKPREGTEQEKRTAEAARLFVEQLNVMPVAPSLGTVPTAAEQQEKQQKADRIGERIRELLEQNAAAEPQA